MRYVCVHCDERFEASGDKPRCPKCMRQHGIEKLKGEAQSGAARKPWLLPAIVVSALVLAGVGYAVWAQSSPDTVTGDVPMRPLELSEVRGHMRHLHATTRDYEQLFIADEAIERFAADATRGKASPQDKAEGVTAALRERASKRAFITWPLSAPRETPVRDARATMEKVAHDDGREKLYPLEVAALAASALRSEGVDAMLAEVYAFRGDTSPPDPSGYFGYYVVAVYPENVGEGTPRFFDPFGGHGTAPVEDQVRVVSDVQAIGAALNHLAVHRLVNEGDTTRSFELADEAMRLDTDSPQVRGVMGAIAILSGGVEEGVQQFRAAAQLRPDAPRHNLLAGLALTSGDVDEASREAAAALEVHPDFAAGHATLAAIHLARSELEDAQRELEKVEQLDSTLPNLPMLWANYYVENHEPERAVEKAREAIERKPHDWQARLSAARIFRVAGDFDAMRAEARRVVDMVDASRRAQVEALIGQLLGPTALEAEDVAPDDELADTEEGEEGSFRLDSKLLGGGTSMAGGASLLGADERLGGGGEEPSSFRLGGGEGEGLRLDLGSE